MTDVSRTEPMDTEEKAIEQALSQAMATGSEPRLLPKGEAADPALVREYTEILGLLPYELPPETPASHLKEEILNRIRGGFTADTSTRTVSEGHLLEATSWARPDASSASAMPPDASSASAKPPGASPATTMRPAASYPAANPPAANPLAVSQPPQRAWGNLAMAAALGACLVGLGFTGGLAWKQSVEIDQLHRQVVGSGTNPLAAQIAQVRNESEILRRRLEMITVVAREAYPMRPVSHASSQGPMDGIVYVCGQHQRWYLNLQGLEPPQAGKEYRLWFMTEEGRVDGGVLDVQSDRTTEMDATSMPLGVRGFAVTLESSGPTTEPESLTILLGEQPVRL